MRTPPPLPPSAWASFLEARLALIAEWTDTGLSIPEMVRALSVDPEQVRLLQETNKARRLASEYGRAPCQHGRPDWHICPHCTGNS